VRLVGGVSPGEACGLLITFTDCSFEGELSGVLFYRTGFRGERFPPNEMKRVDFRRAKLPWTEFRGLDLDEVFFPEDDDHIVIDRYPETLDRLLAHFCGRSDMGSRRLATRFEHRKKWLGPHQRVGGAEEKRPDRVGRRGGP
jgi:hypothetical protein